MGFLHFCQWRWKAHSPLTNTAFFSNCSGLLRCIKQGSRQFPTIFTTSGNACACVSFRKHGSASGRVYGSDQIVERNRNIFFFFHSFYSGNCQNTEISACTFQFYESLYKYRRTFTHTHTHYTHTHTHTLHAIHTHTHTHTLPSEEVPDSLLTGTNVFAQQFRTLERQEHENEKSPDTNDKTHPTPFKQSKLTPYQKAVLKERKKKKRNLKKNDY